MARKRKRFTEKEMQRIMEKEYFLEWNEGVPFSSIAPYSKERVYWRCTTDDRHVWPATPSNRRRHQSMCPFCAGQKVLPEDSIVAKAAHLLVDWDYETNERKPEEFAPQSNKSVKWKCSVCDHRWQAKVQARFLGRGCPACAGKVVTDRNSVAALHPELVGFWSSDIDQLSPQQVTPGSDKRMTFQCENGHRFENSVRDLVKNGRCVYCDGRKVTPERNLAVLHPSLLEEWDYQKNSGKNPHEILPAHQGLVWWKCFRGHLWKATPGNRVYGQTGCPYCVPASSRLERRLYAEILSLFPDTRLRSKIAGKEVDIYVPSLSIGIEVDGSYWHRAKVRDDIEKGKTLSEKGIQLVRLREKPLEELGENDLVFNSRKQYLKIVKRAMQLIASLVSNHDAVEALKRYQKHNSFQNQAVYDEIDGGNAPYEKSLAHLYPKIAAEWHPGENGRRSPSDVYAHSAERVTWLCSENPSHLWETQISGRTSRKSGCPFCSHRSVHETNRLDINYPEIASEWAQEKNGAVTPADVPFRRSRTRYWWRCENGHLFNATPNQRTITRVTCPVCASLGHRFPKLAKEWHPTRNLPTTPYDRKPKSNKKVWWQCSYDSDHTWEATPNDRVSKGAGCPYCAGTRVTRGHNLAEVYPRIAKEWHLTKNGDITPNDVAPKSNKTAWWQCPNGHAYQSRIANRTVHGSGCPTCNKPYTNRKRCDG